ncbi:MAG: response regulator [Bacteroidales bacterium]|nr:response regulator [Bacteroidales bacterium]
MPRTTGQGGQRPRASISKNLVELMGGHVTVESAPQQGANFRFTLPFSEHIAHTGQLQALESGNTDERRDLCVVKILLVEDDHSSQLYIEELLNDDCYHMVTASGAKEALEKAESNRYDIILMDIRLPDGNGLDVVKKIRETNRKVCIIAQTAYAMRADAENAITAGCNDYIAKPINKDVLLKKIWMHLNKEASHTKD